MADLCDLFCSPGPPQELRMIPESGLDAGACHFTPYPVPCTRFVLRDLWRDLGK